MCAVIGRLLLRWPLPMQLALRCRITGQALGESVYPKEQVKVMTNKQSNARETLRRQLEQQREYDNPPHVKDAFRRLTNAGHSEEAILDMCMWVLASEYFRTFVLKQALDMERYGSGLNRLPVMPWEDDGSDYKVDVTKKDVQEVVLDNPNLTMETPEQTKERYLRLRSLSKDIHKAIMPLIDREVFLASARSPGLMKGKTLVADSVYTLSVLADHCIYANPKYRHKLLKTYRSRHATSIDLECSEFLGAMDEARYAVLFCEGVLPGLGVQVRNMLTNEVIRLLDINMAEAAKTGLVICSQIIAPHGMYMTTGAPLPILSKAAVNEVAEVVREYMANDRLQRDGIKNDRGEFATRVIGILLRHSVMEKTEYR